MDYEILMKTVLKDHPKRIEHILGVKERALELGQIYQADLEVLTIAALFHDITKYYSLEEHCDLIKDKAVILNQEEFMLHAQSASYYALQFGIQNEKILEAIRYHIWGKEEMSLETMIIVVSDYCEKSREFTAAKEVYALSKINLKESYLLFLKESMKYLKSQGISPHKEQIRLYNYYKGEQHC